MQGTGCAKARRLSTRRVLAMAGLVAIVSASGCAQKQRADTRKAGEPARSVARQESPAAHARPTPGPTSGPSATTGGKAADAARALRPEQMREEAVETLVGLAKSDVPEFRANAVEGLIASQGRLRLVAVEALRDPNPGVRGVAAMAVARAGLCTLREDVRPLLTDPVPQVRASAILALWKCQDRVDPTPLGEMLKSDRPEVRAQAAFVLGEMKDSSARPMLADTARDLIKRASPGAQRLLDLQIAEARIKLGDEVAVSDIRAALFPARNDDLEATALAAQIAGEVRDRWSINALAYLTTMLDDQGRPMPPEVRLSAAGALAKMGVPAGPATAETFLTSPIAAYRAQAAMVLGWSKEPKHLPSLYAMMRDSSERVRIAAAAAVLSLTGEDRR